MQRQDYALEDRVSLWERVKRGARKTVSCMTLAGALFFSNGCGDSGRISFATEEDIFIANDDGSGKTNLTNTPNNREYSPSWSEDGKEVLFNFRDSEGIQIMSLDTQKITEISPPNSQCLLPLISPDKRKIAFVVPYSGGKVYVTDYEGSNAKKVSDYSIYDPPFLKWLPDSTRIAFRVSAGKLSGGVRTGTRVGIAGIEDMSIKIAPQLSVERPVRSYSLSCDGKIVVDIDGDLYLSDLDGKNAQNLTNTPKQFEGCPEFSSNGKKIAFVRNSMVCVMNADGSGITELSDYKSSDIENLKWSSGGGKIAFQDARDIWAVSASGSQPQNVTNTPNVEEIDYAWLP